MAEAIVIGAGAAGLMCAATAARRGRKVLVLEHQREAGRKILASGGGRCNFTNLEVGAGDFISENPHFARSALARYPPADFMALMEKHGLGWHEKEAGQLFCDQEARAVRDMLRAECREAGARISTGVTVGEIRRDGKGFAVDVDGRSVHAQHVVIATGGLSLPKLGATPFGYRVAERFGIPVIPPRPGLVPLIFAPPDAKRFGDLAGVSATATVRCGGHAFTGGVLFTHRGLSGPAVLNAASYWQPGGEIAIDFLPGLALIEYLEGERARRPRARLRTVLADKLPRRLAHTLAGLSGEDHQLARLSGKAIRAVAERLSAWPISASGTGGWKQAEVTVGGVDTRALSSKTMEASEVPGLFFVGEVVDVTGKLGGYNFQWAWASGHAAGEAV